MSNISRRSCSGKEEIQRYHSIMVHANRLEFGLFLAGIPFYIIGFIGNVLVIRIVHKTRQMHTTTNYLLANLAACDLITILLAPLYFFSYLLGYPSNGFGKISCKILVLTDISIMASGFTLAVLAVERYHALLKPFRTGLRLKEGNIKQAIALIWIASVLLVFPQFFLQEWSESHSTCIGPWSTEDMNHTNKIYVLMYCVFNAYIPITVFLYCYGSLLKGLYFSHTICAADTDEDRSSEKRKLVITFIVATAGYAISCGPIAVFFTLQASGVLEQSHLKLHSSLSVVFHLLLYCSLCLNPILYAFRSTNFQEGFKRIIFCRGEAPSE